MSTIRRQSIISTLVTYIGFAVGFLNVYFFTKDFQEEQYGLTTIFVAIATLMTVLAMMATPSYIVKFYPYYKDHLPPNKNDMITWSLLISCIGFLLVIAGGWFFKDLVIRKFGENSPLLLTYYYWIFPMGFGLTIFSVLEAYAWAIGKSVVSTFLKEMQWRIITTVLIVVFLVNHDFDLFIKLYAFTYPAIAVSLLGYLIATKKIHFTFSVSKVSSRYFGKIIKLCTYFYAGTIVFTVAQVFDSILIASVLQDGLKKAGIFGLAQVMAGVIQAPQRGIIAASVSHLSQAWKDKNMALIQRIYQRSSINQIIFASGLFLLILLNYTEAVKTFDMKDSYLTGFSAFILLGLTRLIDMGTGVNAQIISTSTWWKFELFSGVILLLFMLPLNYILTQHYDILGPAMANLISISIYNSIRIGFLWKKFNLFPFTMKSVYTVLLAAVTAVACYFIFRNLHGFAGLLLRSIFFIGIYSAGVIYLKLSPDIQPVVQAFRKRIGL